MSKRNEARAGMGLSSTLIAIAVGFGAARAAPAGSHLWRINEVFSNADGTVQFVELYECCGAARETLLRGLEFTSEARGSVFTFPENLAPPTSNRYLLLATRAFAELDGAPTPDYVLPEAFFSPDGDTLWYSEVRNYDHFSFGPGALPTDGVHAIQLVSYANDAFESGVNSPTNYAGETGSVSLARPFARGDCNDDGARDVSDAMQLLSFLFLAGGSIPCGDACDANDDGRLDITDPVTLLVSLFASRDELPAPHRCGADPTGDELGCPSFAPCP